MTLENLYIYYSNVLSLSSMVFSILFIAYNSLSSDIYKVNVTQGLLTIAISLFILSFITKNAKEQDELNKPLFYFTFILGIPLLYHLLYLMFFQDDIATKMKLIKIYILFAIMGYLSLIWYNVMNAINSNMLHSNFYFEDVIKVLTIY